MKLLLLSSDKNFIEYCIILSIGAHLHVGPTPALTEHWPPLEQNPEVQAEKKIVIQSKQRSIWTSLKKNQHYSGKPKNLIGLLKMSCIWERWDNYIKPIGVKDYDWTCILFYLYALISTALS